MKPKNTIYYTDIDDEVFLNAAKRRRFEAEGHWNKQGLKKVREDNIKDYLAKYVDEQLIDERYQEVYNDNRQFVSVRTILPFLTARLTAPEVTPANGKDSSIQFAHDFEEAMQRHAERQHGRAKVRLSVQDLLKGERVGIGKWRYDAQLDTVIYEHVKPETVIIGKRGKQYEEPDYMCQDIERSVADLINMFPDKEAKIKELFGIDKGTPSQMEKVYEVREEWLWIYDSNYKKELVVGWTWQNYCFGKIKDPNWNENGKNVIDNHMMPYVFFNILNNGSGYIDETSFIEQAKWSQQNYNKRGQTIAENAKYGGTGVPIFAKGSISQKDVAKVRFSPIQRVLLDTADVSKSFTVWQSTPLPSYVVEDKNEQKQSIDNIWGANDALRGQQSDNKTLGQDVMNRDQAEGRLSDPVDCIDDSMTRFYQLEAQLMFRYFTEKKYVNYIGNDGKFVSIAISNQEVADNVGIQIGVKAGTSLPIDRSQRRATVMQLLQINKIGTLTAYKTLDLFDDPEAAYKEYLLETVDPPSALQEVDKQVFDRDAFQDLMQVIAGEVPEEREDVDEEYGQYLQNWLETDKFMLLQRKDDKAAARVSSFVDHIIQKLARKMNKMQMLPTNNQPPPPPDAQPPQSGNQQPVPPVQPPLQPAAQPLPQV